MAVTYDGGTGLMDVLGAYAKTANDVRAHAAALSARYHAHLTRRPAAEMAAAGELLGKLGAHQADLEASLAGLRHAAEREVVATMQAEGAPGAGSVSGALAALGEAMEADGQALEAASVSAVTTPAAGNGGDAELVVGLIDAEGRELFEAVPETLEVLVTSGPEPAEVVVAGGASLGWTAPDGAPEGSGALAGLRLTSAAAGGSDLEGRSATVNGRFLDAEGDVPRQWQLAAGTAGRDVLCSGTAGKDGRGGLELVGDGTTQPELRQEFGRASGSPASLVPGSVYCLAFWLRLVSGTPAAGVVRARVTDATGTLLAAGAEVTAAVPTASGSFALQAVTFGLPAGASVDGAELRLDVATPISAGATVAIDDVALVRMAVAYPGGPRLALLEGTAPVAGGDAWEVAVANPNDAGTLLGALNRLLALRERGVRWPAATSGATLGNSLLA